MSDKLHQIGFYTLNDARARNVGIHRPLARCELILTDACNFRCPYCRGPKQDREMTMPYDHAANVVKLWASEGLINIRFSGGEPTTYKRLPDLIRLSKSLGIKRIAISTNGSAQLDYYKQLITCGVSDISISLDAHTPEGVREMSGGLDVWNRLISNIRELSALTYVTVGMVFNERNVGNAKEAVMFAADLGVSDIRVLSSAQFNAALDTLEDLPDDFLERFPILKYRVNNFRRGRNVRGLAACDSNKCKLVLDDMAVAGREHFPCIIYLREGGQAIGKIHQKSRKERLDWCNSHDTQSDAICSANCLDVCVDYNNTASGPIYTSSK